MGKNRNSYTLVGKFEGKLPTEGSGLVRENIIKMVYRDYGDMGYSQLV
jgi:hypothetical protein